MGEYLVLKDSEESQEMSKPDADEEQVTDRNVFPGRGDGSFIDIVVDYSC
jgi:hypothetical protein